MNVEKIIAGIFVGIGSIYLIHLGYIEAGAGILGTMVGFFVGNNVGKKKEA